MKLNSYQKVFVGYFFLLVVYWITLQYSHQTDSIYNFLYSFLFSLVPLIGGLIGMFQSKIWGGLKSAVGKAIFFISLGLFAWGSGSMLWSYYNLVLHITAPYPSLADLGFASSIFLYGLGAIYLSKATGAKFGLRSTSAKIFAVVSSVIILVISYYILIIVARAGVIVPDGETPLKAALDIAYPLGDFFSLVLALVISGLSFKYLGGRYIIDITAILTGLGVMFIGDSIFSYTTTVGTFHNGDFGDLVLTIGLFLLTYGVLGFYKAKDNS